jgi:hypothetical protein
MRRLAQDSIRASRLSALIATAALLLCAPGYAASWSPSSGGAPVAPATLEFDQDGPALRTLQYELERQAYRFGGAAFEMRTLHAVAAFEGRSGDSTNCRRSPRRAYLGG